MKFLFSADWHLKLGQKSVPREWARNRYNILFSELSRVKHEYGVDAEGIGGDIFDKLPNLEELSIFMSYISKQLNPIYIYDGNHEATRKGQTFMTHLEEMLFSVHPDVTLFTDYYQGNTDFPFDVIPYCKLKEFEKKGNFSKRVPALLTHVRGEIPPHVLPEIDLEKLKEWDVVFAGDLHAHSNTQGNIVYPGSPLTTSFHRSEAKTGVLIIDTEDYSWEWVKLEVPQLIRKTVSSEDEIVKTDFHHTIYELEGDAIDLAKISKDNDLLDKKLVSHNSESTLKLEGLTVKEELQVYLRDIITLDEEKLKKALEVYDDYINESEVG
jgi:DNA repair exonuclease SbcCD nuclease subunit